MSDDYEAYGEEWKKEMKKFPKDQLIEMLKKVLTNTDGMELWHISDMGEDEFGDSFVEICDIHSMRITYIENEDMDVAEARAKRIVKAVNIMAGRVEK